MKQTIKETLDEMIAYVSRYQISDHLKSTEGKMDPDDLFSALGSLLMWHWLCRADPEGDSPDQKMIDNPYEIKRFEEAFDFYVSLEAIYVLHPDHIGWHPSLSDTDRSDIITYVEKNYHPVIRVSYYPPEPK